MQAKVNNKKMAVLVVLESAVSQTWQEVGQKKEFAIIKIIINIDL